MTRFAGFQYPGGVLVLDTWTGEVVRVPADGSGPVVLRNAAASHGAPDAASTAVGFPAPPAADPAAATDAAAHAAATRAASEAPPEAAPTLPANATALDREVVATFPYPVASTWLAFLGEDDPRQRCKLLVDTFTAVLKMWALQTASEYLRAEGVKDASVNQTLKRDFARPLISAWNLMLGRALPVLEQAGVEPFAPELRRAYTRLETKCKDRVIVEVRYEDADGNIRYRKSKLGKIQALIRYRNSLAHGYNQSRQKAEKDLETQLPVLRDVLEEARFMARYPLHHLAQPERRPGEDAVAYRLTGAWPSSDPVRLPGVRLEPERSPLFLWNEAEGDALPLHVFLDMDIPDTGHEAIPGLGRDVVLFEGNTKNTVIYVSVDGGHIEKQSRIRQWKAQIESKALEVKSLTRDSVSLDALRKAASQQTDAALEQLVRGGKYIPQATVTRRSIEEAFAQLDHGDYRAMVLGGHGGMGKSTLLAHYVERRREAGDVVLFYRASTLADADLPGRILRDLGVRGMFFEDFLATADDVFQDGTRLRIVVDAVNEHPSDAAELVRSIDSLVRQAETFPWFRLVSSIRTTAYERLPTDARFGRAERTKYLLVERQQGEATVRSPIVEVPPFGPGDIAEVYERYRSYRRPDPDEPEAEGTYVFRPRTPFEELDPHGSTCAMMRNPLMLRLLVAAFHRHELPSQVSFDEAMKLYMDHVVVEQNNPDGAHPQRRKLLYDLVRQLDAIGAEAISRERLHEVDRLKAAVQNPQKDSPYVQLLDLGILLEEWDDDECMVRFAFDGLFTYLLARVHEERIDTPADLLNQTRRAREFRNLRKSLVVVARRLMSQGGHDVVFGALEQCELDAEGESGETARLLLELVRDGLVNLGHYRDAKFETVVAQFPQHRSAAQCRTLLGAFDELFRLGEIAAATAVAEAAVEQARAIGVGSLHAAALLRWGQQARQRGEVDAASDAFERARELALESGNGLQAYRIDLWRGRILLTRGRYDEARAVSEGAYEGLREAEAMPETAEALRLLATLAGRQDRRDEQERLTIEAKELSERIGDRAGTAKALNNLAAVQLRLGRHEDAEKTFLESLSLKEELGDRASIATTLMNLSTLYLSALGWLDQAERYLHRARSIFADLEHHEGISLADINLGISHLLRAQYEEAERCLEEALSLCEERDEPKNVAYASWLLATLALDRGQPEAARPRAARLDELAQRLGSSQSRVQAAAIALRLAVVEGDAKTVTSRLDALETLAAEHDAISWEVEDGPAGAYLDAARYLSARDDDRAAELARKAASCVRGRPFHRTEALEALLEELGLQAGVNVATVGEC